MANKYQVLIDLAVKKAESRKELNKEIKVIQEEINSLELDVKVSTTDIKQAKKEVEKLEKAQIAGTKENTKAIKEQADAISANAKLMSAKNKEEKAHLTALENQQKHKNKEEIENLRQKRKLEDENFKSQQQKIKQDLDTQNTKMKQLRQAQQQEAIENRMVAQAKQREVYEKQLLAIRQQYSKAFSVTSGLKNDDILKQYNDMMSTLKNGGDISNMSKEMSILRNEIKSAGLDSKSFGDMMVSNFSKFTQWLSIGTVIMQTINQVKQAYQFTVEMDSALTNINFTMDMTASQLRGISEASLQMADDLNTSAKNIMQGVTLYANANETAESILNKTKPATMLSNVTGMQVEQTAHILQSVMNQMDMTQEDLMHISDVLQGTSVLMAHDFSKQNCYSVWKHIDENKPISVEAKLFYTLH